MPPLSCNNNTRQRRSNHGSRHFKKHLLTLIVSKILNGFAPFFVVNIALVSKICHNHYRLHWGKKAHIDIVKSAKTIVIVGQPGFCWNSRHPTVTIALQRTNDSHKSISVNCFARISLQLEFCGLCNSLKQPISCISVN